MASLNEINVWLFPLLVFGVTPVLGMMIGYVVFKEFWK